MKRFMLILFLIFAFGSVGLIAHYTKKVPVQKTCFDLKISYYLITLPNGKIVHVLYGKGIDGQLMNGFFEDTEQTRKLFGETCK